MTDPRHTRRDFCVHACQAVSLASLAGLLDACSGGNPNSPSSAPALPTINASVSGGAITLIVDGGPPRAQSGSAALVQTASGNFLVARTATDTFTALTAICTHEACTVTGFQNQRYVCPCHGSQYSLTGAVLQGPAPSALRQFATRLAGNVLTITIS